VKNIKTGKVILTKENTGVLSPLLSACLVFGVYGYQYIKIEYINTVVYENSTSDTP
jgi:hypothetical protein